MKISKNSWHYKFLRWMNSCPEDNLCPYVRQVIGHMLLLVLFGAIICVIAVVSSYPIWRWWIQEGVLGFVSGCLWIVVGIGAIKTYHEEWTTSAFYHERSYGNGMFNMTKWYHRQLIPQAVRNIDIHIPRPSHDNIFLERARAAHDKVCPQLEFTRDGDSPK